MPCFFSVFTRLSALELADIAQDVQGVGLVLLPAQERHLKWAPSPWLFHRCMWNVLSCQWQADVGNPELLDDSDFYQQLLLEFLESADPNGLGGFQRLL